MILKVIGPRHTYVLPDTGNRYKRAQPHTQVCMTEPMGADGVILSFSIGTYVNGKDISCLLNVGDHPKVLGLSTMYYGTPHIRVAADILKKINSKELEYCGMVSEAVFKRIYEGALDSDFTKPECKKLLELHPPT